MGVSRLKLMLIKLSMRASSANILVALDAPALFSYLAFPRRARHLHTWLLALRYPRLTVHSKNRCTLLLFLFAFHVLLLNYSTLPIIPRITGTLSAITGLLGPFGFFVADDFFNR